MLLWIKYKAIALMMPFVESDELGKRYNSEFQRETEQNSYLNGGHSLHSFARRLLQERPHVLNLVLHLGHALGRAQQLQRHTRADVRQERQSRLE